MAASPRLDAEESGFSIVELLVAFVILSLALGIVVQSLSLSAGNLSRTNERQLATEFAKSFLAEAQSLTETEIGERFPPGEDFVWNYRRSIIPASEIEAMGYQIVRHDLTVHRPSPLAPQYSFSTLTLRPVGP